MSLILSVSYQFCVLSSVLFLQSLLLFFPWCLPLFLFPYVSTPISHHLYCSLCLSPSILLLYLCSITRSLPSMSFLLLVFPTVSSSLSSYLSLSHVSTPLSPLCPPLSSSFSPHVSPFLCISLFLPLYLLSVSSALSVSLCVFPSVSPLVSSMLCVSPCVYMPLPFVSSRLSLSLRFSSCLFLLSLPLYFGALTKRPHLKHPSNVSTPSERPPNTMSKCSLRPL
jgi:hypothetical protein